MLSWLSRLFVFAAMVAVIVAFAKVPAGYTLTGPAPSPPRTSLTLISNITLGTATGPTGLSGGYNAIGTNGSMSYAAGYTGPATGTVGAVQINNLLNNTNTANVRCEGSLTMTNVGGSGGSNTDLSAPLFEVVMNTGVAPGAANACVDTSTNSIANYAISTTPANNIILVGMKMDASDPVMGGQYALSNNGAGTLTISVRVPAIPALFYTAETRTIEVDAFSVFNTAATLTAGADMDFGTVDVTSGALGASDYVTLGTNGALTDNGKFSVSGSGTAGSVTIGGVVNGESIDITCDNSATLTDGSGNSIQVTGINWAAEDGTNTLCYSTMISDGTYFAYASGSNDQVFFGGKLDGSTASGTLSGSFSTANAGGNDLAIVATRI